jgi:ascorbate-specific PTS system EIIC-type component UlaA
VTAVHTSLNLAPAYSKLASYLQRQYCIYYSYHSDFISTKTILYLLRLSLWLHIYKDNIVFITAITLTSYLQRQYCIYYSYHSDFIYTKTILYVLQLSFWLHIYKDNIVFITAITLTSYLQRQYCIYYSYNSDFHWSICTNPGQSAFIYIC